MQKKYSIPIIFGSALTMFSFLGLIKAIDTKETWKIVCATISLVGFLFLLIMVIVQMIKEKRAKGK